MANTEVVVLILKTASELIVYMLPILGVLSGLVFIISWLYQWTFGASRSIR